MEGLKGVMHSIHTTEVVAITVAILLALFSIQRYGTSTVSVVFAPVICAWLLLNAGIGLHNVVKHHTPIVRALHPGAWMALARAAPVDTWHKLSGVLLCVTGAWERCWVERCWVDRCWVERCWQGTPKENMCWVVSLDNCQFPHQPPINHPSTSHQPPINTGTEALFADLAHFSRPAIQLSCIGLVFPALTLTYLGQVLAATTHCTCPGRTLLSCIPRLGKHCCTGCLPGSPPPPCGVSLLALGPP